MIQFRCKKPSEHQVIDGDMIKQMIVSPKMCKLQVAAYCRVSTTLEDQLGSLQAQEDYYKELIHSKPQWQFAGIYMDKASGRCNQKMPQFQNMMTACRDGKIDFILVKSVSRFGRDTLEMLLTFNELRELGVDIYFEVEKIYLKNPKAMLMLTIYASLTQAESENLSYNIRWGIRRGFMNGTSRFLSRSCNGYKTNEDGNLEIIPEEAQVVRQIFQWRAEGDSLRTISAKLKQCGIKAPPGGDIWGTETLSKLLTNEKYMGNVLLQKTFVKDFHIGKQVKNLGQLAQYYVYKNNPAIIMIDE